MDRLLLSALMAEADEPTQFIGFLDVLVHEARDIQNICIYHKQDVYAKLWLTTDGPESAVSTRTINGGGRNPVFDQRLRLGVRTVEPPSSSVRCEVWMLSRIKNYLEDQLLGFALVPLSDVVTASGKRLVDEFPLSSTDLFHSPSGFVKLSVEYTGSLPEVMLVAPPLTVPEEAEPEPEPEPEPVPCEWSRIEFPDLDMVDENKMMVSEYFGIPCSNVDTQNSESLTCPEEEEDCPDHQAGVRVVESLAAATCPDPAEVPKDDTPASSPSTITTDLSSLGTTTEIAFPPPVIDIDVEPRHSVVQQDIVDMYMKSMQQFTESLANMKLPMDIEDDNGNGNGNGSGNGNGNGGGNVDTANGGSGADQKLLAAKKTNSRVFYGSRAFF